MKHEKRRRRRKNNILLFFLKRTNMNGEKHTILSLFGVMAIMNVKSEEKV